MGLGAKIQQIGNPELSPWGNIFSMFCFFCFGLNFLIFYNGIVNLGDLLFNEFGDYELNFMSTYPLFLNWFNFFFAFSLVILAIYVKKFPYNLLIHIHFIIYLVLFAVTPFVIQYIENNAAKFWVMVIITVLGGIPCQLSGGIVTSLAGLFSNTHNTMYLIGSSAGGIIVSLLRIMSGAVFPENRYHDYYLSLWVNVVIVANSYALYFILYYGFPFTQIVIKRITGVHQPAGMEEAIRQEEERKAEEKRKREEEKMKKRPMRMSASGGMRSSNHGMGMSSSGAGGLKRSNHQLGMSKKYEKEQEQKLAESARFSEIIRDNVDEEDQEEEDGLWKQVVRVFKKTWVQLLSMALDYFWTFCVFAGIFLGIPYDESVLDLSLSQQITTFCFMGGDFLARILIMIPIKWNRWVVFVLSNIRCLFYVIIFIYYFDVYTNPFLMFFVMLVFSTTHGLFASAAIGLCFSTSLPKDMKMTANFCNLALDLGLSLGATGLFLLNLIFEKTLN